jgi:hypothetical protein
MASMPRVIALQRQWYIGNHEPPMAAVGILGNPPSFEGALDNRFDPLPGIRLAEALDLSHLEAEDWKRTGAKIEHSVRKMLMMWTAGEKALEAERDFYSTTVQEAPALYGTGAVEIQYHCEALVFFARSAMDLAGYAFGKLLPPPLSVKRADSFNDLLKAIVKQGPDHPLATLIESWRVAEPAWLPLIAGLEKGRSLRDQLAHQKGFPLHYRDISLSSEKRSAIVALSHSDAIPLKALVETLRLSVVEAFRTFENVCVDYQAKASILDGTAGAEAVSAANALIPGRTRKAKRDKRNTAAYRPMIAMHSAMTSGMS